MCRLVEEQFPDMNRTRHKAIQSKLEPAVSDADRYASLGQSETSDDREQFSELLEAGSIRISYFWLG